jgi:biotin carboxyl carrier protein
MKYFVTLDKNREYEIDVEPFDKSSKIKVGQNTYIIDVLWTTDEVSFVALVNNKPYPVAAKWIGSELTGVFLNRPFSFLIEDIDDNMLRKISVDTQSQVSDNVVKSPLSGVVTRIIAEANSHVQTGDPILIIEAMKMENVFNAPCDGRVTKILVKPNEQVKPEQLLYIFEAS